MINSEITLRKHFATYIKEHNIPIPKSAKIEYSSNTIFGTLSVTVGHHRMDYKTQHLKPIQSASYFIETKFGHLKYSNVTTWTEAMTKLMLLDELEGKL